MPDFNNTAEDVERQLDEALEGEIPINLMAQT